MSRILLLGGTTEAALLARALAAAAADAVYSYAGRVASPAPQPLPVRTGGFGGVPGLVDHLRRERIGAVIDATHPFAAGMSANAVAACAQAGVPLAAFERAPWPVPPNAAQVPDIAAAVAALPEAPASVFLSIGRQHLGAFAARPQHRYLLRLVDPPDGPLPLPSAKVEIARGPFDAAGDTALMRRHGIGWLVAKNAGGSGAAAKLDAAAALGIRTVLVARPVLPDRRRFDSVAGIMEWLDHHARLGV